MSLPNCRPQAHRSHETLHKTKQLIPIYHSIAIFINLVEECIAHALIERFFVTDLRKGRLSQRYNLISVERSRAILVVFEPESVDDHAPLVVIRCIVVGCRVGFLCCS